MHKPLLILALLLGTVGPGTINAGITPIPEHDAAIGLGGHNPGGASGACSIAYYNWCSGWIWLLSGFSQLDQAGVVYDLTETCGGGEGHSCTNIGNWWYWRYALDGYCGYGFTISYDIYGVDTDNCLLGPPIGSLSPVPCQPLERWNYVPGMGSTTNDRVALVATWTQGTFPYLATDNNVTNATGGPACAGVGIGTGSSVYFGNPGATAYCPPVPFTDARGPTNIIAISIWNCASTTATETSSWTDLKQLFR